MKLSSQHWSLQRLSAVLLIPLSYWLFAFLQLCLRGNYFELTAWLDSSINKIGLASWLSVVCYHAAIGVQVVLEDYVSNQDKQHMAIWATRFYFVILALSGIVFIY